MTVIIFSGIYFFGFLGDPTFNRIVSICALSPKVAKVGNATATVSGAFDNKTSPIEQHTLKNVNICLNTNTYSYLETSGGQSFNLYVNVVHFFNASVN
jgi:hypothetical protein